MFNTVIWSEMGMSPVEILKLIEILRERLNTLALNKPLVDPEVIQPSQRLDSLLNIYNKIENISLFSNKQIGG